MNVKCIAGLVLAAVLGLVPPANSADTGTIYDRLVAEEKLAVFTVAVKEAGEVETLKKAGPYTLFAPTDAAFKKLDDATVLQIATQRAFVQQLFRSHLVSGQYTLADLKKRDGEELKTVNGARLKVTDAKDGVRVGGVKITTADLSCGNGVIHIIEAVLPVPKP